MAALEVGSLSGRKILLAVTGSIAAYKTPLLLRQLTEAGALVRVIMTPSAEKFIGAAVFQGLGADVFTDMWEGKGELHVELAAWAELCLVAPATADTLSRMAYGRADDLITATLLCSTAPVAVAPAMHPRMWQHPATVRNVRILSDRGVSFLGPVFGQVASGDNGTGRMEEPERIAEGVGHLMRPDNGILKGRRIVITAGPTREALDPVRALTNSSSGKMGYALAGKALSEGAQVTLITGPVSITAPIGAKVIRVESALQMRAAMRSSLGKTLGGADALIMTAAVSDYRPAEPSAEKIKRAKGEFNLALLPNPDLLAEIGRKRGGLRPVLVGFALETKKGDELIALGRNKLVQKQVDLIVANNAAESLGREDAVVRLVSARDCIQLEKMNKFEVAKEILDWLARRLAEPETPDQTH